MPKYLLIQSRPEIEASDDEFRAFCKFGGLDEAQVERLQMHEVQPEVNLDDYTAVLMGGGPANFAYDDDHKSVEQKSFEPWLFALLDEIVAQDKPFLGACLGLGALVTHSGGNMSFDYSEAVGAVEVNLTDSGSKDPMLVGVPGSFRAFVGHKEGAGSVPPHLTVLASNDSCIQMARIGMNIYATQFHPELDPAGLELRIQTYKHAGYFRPDEAEQLIADGWASDVGGFPTQVLRNFTNIYL
ncbi:MAG: gamma-glutamyl-gamma-aminobutyrate hydrolase family protein [Candidatus Saccharimonadaceae bacterium]